MPTWTKEQNDAIKLDGTNIIVSAGAGSGKTAVLSERVLTKVLNGISIDHMLILTFTKAAASEMKERIRKKIKEHNLYEQLNKIDSSFITTFDSYSLSLVKKYHYLLNVKKDINIIEENVLKLKTKEFLNDIMEEKYRDKDENFVKLITDFCVKDDDNLRESILLLNDKLNMKYSKKEYLNNYIDRYYDDNYVKEIISKYEKYICDIINEINHLLTKLSEYVDTDYLNKIMSVLKSLLKSNNYNDIKLSLVNIKLPNLPKNSEKEASNIKKNIKEKLDEIKLLAKYENISMIEYSILSTKPYIKSLIDIINCLDNKLEKYKRENDLYDFIDISKMAIKIVMENNNIKEEIKNYFNEILVDEYQDTSDLQEEFLNLISNNNLYMVGDVKQSIYRFRNANPNIFRNKYNCYSKNIGGIKIDLLKNFRSRYEVLDNVNLIFNLIMSDDIGGASYKEGHQMIFGNTSYEEEGKTNQNNQFEVYKYNSDIKEFTKDEIEAFIIADDILNKVHNHYQVFDKDKKVLRDITFSDFSILVDRSSNFELFKKIFLYKQIPLSIYKDEYLTNSSLFQTIKSIFKLLSLLKDNGQKKEIEYYFLSISRSFLFSYSDNEIFNIIENNSYEETTIFKILRNILLDIDSKSITNILDDIITYFKIYEKLNLIGLQEDNLVKIDYLYSLSTTLNSMGYNYKDFVSFIDNIFDNNSDIRFSLNKEDSSSVKIMTIHKSKGLEYHICYFPNLYKSFNTGDLKSLINYSNNYGIITPYFNDGLLNTIVFDLYKQDYLNEEISEKIRLFYVALTRAKEKMIFILPEKEYDIMDDNSDLVSSSIRKNYKSFLDILYSIKSKIESYIKNIDISSLSLSKDYNLVNSYNLFENFKNTGMKFDIKVYPKYIKKIEEKSKFSKSNHSLIDKKEKDIMKIGTMIHYYLEIIDLKNPDILLIPDEYKDVVNKFLNSSLMKNISNAKIYQEYEFMYNKDNISRHGIIDLLVEYDNHFDIIDYKLKNIKDDDYKLQLNGYKEYLEELSNKHVNIYLYSILDGTTRKL